MNVTGRTLTWLIPSILICGGCAATARLSPTSSVEELTRTEQQLGSESRETRSDPSPMVAAEAALIRETALARGYSLAQAQQFEQSITNALPGDRQFLTRYIYGELNRRSKSQARISDAEVEPPDSIAAPTVASTSEAGHIVPRTTVVPSDLASTPSSSAARAGEAPSVPTERTITEPAEPKVAVNKAASQANPSPGVDSPHVAPASDAKTAQTADNSVTASVTVANDETDNDAGSDNVDTSSTLPDASTASTTGAANRQVRLGTDAESASPNATATIEEDAKTSWQRQLRMTISRLRRDLAENQDLDPLDESRMRACLGLLQLAAEDSERAMEALDGLDEQQLEFWRQTIRGLDILLDSDELPKMRYRVESATEHLQKGLSTLATLGPLRVNNLAFVSGVRSFGVYDEIHSRGFAPGEQAILYVEIGNFTVEEVTSDHRDLVPSRRRQTTAAQVPMYESDLLGRYDILDQTQRVVMSRTLPVIRDRCRQHRRDFFIAYDFYVPKKLTAGHYTLELTIEDRKGDKFGNGTIDLKVR